MDEPSDIGQHMSSVRGRGAAYGGSCLLPKIGMMFAVDRFSRIVACMQGGLKLRAAVAYRVHSGQSRTLLKYIGLTLSRWRHDVE